MVSKQLVIGFAVGLTTAAVFTLMVFYLLILHDRRRKAASSRAAPPIGERYRPEGTAYDNHIRDELGHVGAFEPIDRPLQQRDPTPFSSLSHDHVSMDQSSLTGTGSYIHTVGRPTLAFGAPKRLQNGRPVNYSDGRVNDILHEDWVENRPWSDRPITPRYHTHGMRDSDIPNIPRNNLWQLQSHSNETRSVEGYLNNNNHFISRSFNDSGYSDTVSRPQPVGAGDSSVDETERSSSHSGSFIPAFMNNSHHDYPIRLHRQDLSTHDEAHENSYF